MLIILLLPLGFLVSLFLYLKFGEEWQGALLVVFVVCLAIVLFVLLVGRMECVSDIQKFKATKQTIYNARQNMIPQTQLETIMVAQKIIESNEWLATVQFWNSNPWTSWFSHSDVQKLTPIR